MDGNEQGVERQATSVAAERLMADRRLFQLNDTEWEAFEQLLDKPLPEDSKLAWVAARPMLFVE